MEGTTVASGRVLWLLEPLPRKASRVVFLADYNNQNPKLSPLLPQRFRRLTFLRHLIAAKTALRSPLSYLG